MFSSDGRLVVSGSGDRTVRVWDMTDGSSKFLAITDLPDDVEAGVTSVAISSDGRLVAAGSLDMVRHFLNVCWMYHEYDFHRLYVSGTLARVNCWKRCGDTWILCIV